MVHAVAHSGLLPANQGMRGNYLSCGTSPALPHSPSMTAEINVGLLKKDIEKALASGKTAHGLSLLATNNRNKDLIRDLLKRGQDKRISGPVLIGLATALETSAERYTARPPADSLRAKEAISPDQRILDILDPDIIARLMAVAMHVSPADQAMQADLLIYAHGVAAGLRRLARSPANRDNPGYLEAVEQDVLDAVAGGRR